MSKITNNILNFVTSISLLLLVYSTYIIRGTQSEGYVINIYKQLPFHFYLTLLFCYLSACVLLLAYRKISAILILLLVHIIVLIIPYILGYVSPSRGDEYLYIGLVGKNEFFCFSNLSPTGPLFISALALITGLEKWVLSYFLPVFFSIMFITGMFLFYRIFMNREKLISVAFLSSTIPYFGHFQVSTSAYYLCFCLVPLYLFVLRNALSGKNGAIYICSLLMILLIPLAHPFIFIYITFFFLSLAFSLKTLKSSFLCKVLSLNFFSIRFPHSGRKKIHLFIFLSLTFGFVLLCARYSSQFIDIFLPTLAWRTKALIAEGFPMIPGTSNNFFKFIHLFNLCYGKYYIPLIFILINSIIVWQNRNRFCHHFVHRYPRFLILYIFTFFLELAFLFNPFIPYPMDKFANLNFIIFAQIPLLGYSLYVIFLRKGYTFGLGSTVLILGLLWTLGFFNCFNSPYIGGISEAISQNEMEGIHWLSEVKENYPYIMSFGEKEEINSLTEDFSNNPYRSAEFAEAWQRLPIYTLKSDSKVDFPLESSNGNEPFYLAVTTFPKSLDLDKRKYDEVPVSIRFTRNIYPLYKIYDSLNIEIYENKP